MQIPTGIAIPEKARTWLRVEQRNRIPVDTLNILTEESLSCTTKLVSKLVMLNVDQFSRKE